MVSVPKIIPLQTMGMFAGLFRNAKKKIVHCHGCFDVLHLGHVRHLLAAKKYGDILLVTVTADSYVNKGKGRPVFTVLERAEMLAALECVDYVAVNNDVSAVAALQVIEPDFYVKGSDYRGKNCQEFMTALVVGAEVVFTDTPKDSTTRLLKRIK